MTPTPLAATPATPEAAYAEALRQAALEELKATVAGTRPYLTPEQWKPVAYAAQAPASGVTLDGGVLRTSFERNIACLNAWFAAKKEYREPTPDIGWEKHLPASSWGRILGGAAHALRWGEREDLRRIVDAVVAWVKRAQQPSGYCLPYDEAQMKGAGNPWIDERRNYDRVNLTRGMVAAALVGHRDALPIMRKFYDWLYASPYHAGLPAGPFDGASERVNAHVPPGGLGSAHNGDNGHEGSLLMYFSSVGRPEDLLSVERYFVQDWFLKASAKEEALSLSHYPLHIAHCYVLLTYKAWLDHYRATGAAKYLDGARGAWKIVHDHFLHTGGSLAICEHTRGAYPPDSQFVHVDKEHHTGETCGSVFWADINHRLLQFFPGEAKYADEIEQAIYNVILANQDARGHIRYHTQLAGKKAPLNNINTCCEVMGVPFISSLPQYLYSIAADGLYVNLYAASTIRWTHASQPVSLAVATDFPFSGQVTMKVKTPAPVALKLRLRVPSWTGQAVEVRVNGAPAAHGAPGTYLTLDRTWNDGDAVDFVLPMPLRTRRYTGLDRDPKYERHALLCGPVLLALTGATDLEIPATELPGRLKPVAGKPLEFSVEGVPQARYVPYWQILDEAFTCFPTLR